MNQFFYSGQIRRFVIQFIRMVSNFQVQYGSDQDGNATLQRVPVFYGDGSRQVAQIIMKNSENTLPTVPAMAVYITELTYDRERVQEPYHVSKLQIRQRQYNPVTDQYENHLQGNAFTVERLMPVPYKLGLKLDIWTSNKEQKLQLIEQIGILFNPSMEIQNTDNYVDWSSLTVVTLTNVSWSSRTVPSGTDDQIDVASLTFEIPIWISPPAKVTKMGVIQKIIASIHNSTGDLDEALYNDSTLMGPRQYYTPLNYDLLYVGNTLTLLKQSDIANFDPNAETLDPHDPLKYGLPDKWINLVNIYGSLKEGTSQIRLIMQDGNEIVGTVAYHPANDTLLLFTPDVDTLPTNTLDAVTAIIDPYSVTVNSNILTPPTGTRYLILNPIGDEDNVAADRPIAWAGIDNTNLAANANDIIEYNGSHWVVDFDSVSATETQYLTNLKTNVQYKFKDGNWTKSVEGEYIGGNWTLVL